MQADDKRVSGGKKKREERPLVVLRSRMKKLNLLCDNKKMYKSSNRKEEMRTTP